MNIMRNKILYLVIGICCICFAACTHDSDEPNPVVKNELSRSTITVERTVTLTTPGTLQEELEKVIDDVSTLQKLTIEGPYNGIDVEYWKNSLNHLIEFNLKKAIPTSNKDGNGNYILHNDPYGGWLIQDDNQIAPHSFSHMNKLETLIFPDCVTKIDYRACSDCLNLQTIQFGNSLQEIGDEVFVNSGIISIEIPSSVNVISSSVFSDCRNLENVELNANIEKIPSYMFYNCSELETITLANSINSVGYAAFNNCKSLKSYTPFSNIRNIEHYSFQYSGLEEVDLSKIVNFSNAHRAFGGCENLKKVILPENVTSVYSGLFSGCTSLKEINIPSTLEAFDDQLFAGCGFTEFTVPANIKTIGREVFDANKSLTEVTLNEGLESIGYCAFRGVPITEISIPSTVTELAYGAFESTQIKEITIPETVTTVGGTLFNYCHSLAAIFWNSSADVPYSHDINPNCYVILGDESIVCDSNWKNVITNIDGEYVAESITLCEGGQRDNANMSYSVPKGVSITAKKITYERMFGDYDWPDKNITYPGESSGWQTIVLPFTPTKIEHETKGEIAPFNSGIEDAKPFWLRELTTEGFEDRTTIEPDKAYIIAMPNHDSYLDEYRLYGKIIFSAENVTLKSTFDETTQAEMIYPASEGPEYDLQPTYNYVKHGPLIYALNVTYRINNYYYGSVFARSSSDVYAFEAYVKPGGRLARSAFGIDTSSSNTRSAKEKNTTGIPQIGDM